MENWLQQLSEWGPIAWVLQYEILLWWIASISGALGIITFFAMPWLICLIPEDYFATRTRKQFDKFQHHPYLHWTLRIGKSAGGVLLVLMGMLLAPLPGQGTLLFIIGLLLVEFPGKRRLELWFVRRPGVLRSLNWLRTRRGRPPLRVWDPHSPAALEHISPQHEPQEQEETREREGQREPNKKQETSRAGR